MKPTEQQIDAACSAYMRSGTLREVMRAVIIAAYKAQPDHSGDGGDLQEVGFIVQDEVHGWHFAPTVAWTYLGKGRALYARSNQAAPVPQDGSIES